MQPFNNVITKLFHIDYPIVQAGMVWTSGWKLAGAVSNAGALGLIGSGSMYPDVLKQHIRKCKAATSRSFGVNIPLLYPDIDKHIQTVIEEGIKIVFTSAGNPKTWTPFLKQHGITVVHVVSSSSFAKKAEDAGCDAIVAEGFEAGGHNGREETTTMVLIPAVREAVKIPVLAAGGIATGRQMFAAMILGAEGVQAGSRFVCSNEASNHLSYKQLIANSKEGDTMLSMKKLVPVRLFKNAFFEKISAAESKGATREELAAILGHGRAKKGMLEGDINEGELEIGEVAALIKDIKPAAEIVREIWNDFNEAVNDPFLTITGSK
jgi:enoyl-[acyl-carrier protein] reductase II